MADDEEPQPQGMKTHNADAYATKLAGKVERLVEKKDEKKSKHQSDDEKKEEKKPAGGYDATRIPNRPPGYTLKFTFHRAVNLPFADIPSFSADPFILATIKTSLPKRHSQDPDIIWRTSTIRSNTSPEWNESWIVANVPADGFKLKCRVYDEDPTDHDDRLGNVHVDVGSIGQGWQGIKEQAFKIQKRSGSKRAYFFRGIAALTHKGVHMEGEVFISVEMLGRTEEHSGGRMYTLGPCQWSRHYSPMMGRLAGTKDHEDSDDGKKANKYNFQANQFQLHGPVPEALYHRYVEFKPFVKGMFTGKSLRGWLLNRALHHQHSRIYNYDRTTKYGWFEKPSKEMTAQFLDLTHYDEGGRIYTYVITLDGQFRFTETGKQFGIDLLSKHTMHSDVSIYIAFSGEFFIRRLKNPNKDPEDQPEHPPQDVDGGPPGKAPPKDPSYYHLIIDNDSGTYRPNKDLLPQLKDFLKSNFPGLKVSTLDCQDDEEKMNKMKDEQRKKQKSEGENVVYAQMSDNSSISSSDEEDLAARADGRDPPKHHHSQKIKNHLGSRSRHRHENAERASQSQDTQEAQAGDSQQPARSQTDGTQDSSNTFELAGSDVQHSSPAKSPESLPEGVSQPNGFQSDFSKSSIPANGHAT